MSFVNDTFTDSDKVLQSHTGEAGATWTIHPVRPSASIYLASNQLRGNATGANIYYASGTPAAADYTVEADFTTEDSNPTEAGIMARMSTTTDTWIWADWNGSQWILRYRINGGTIITLGTPVTHTPLPGHTYHLKLMLVGSDATFLVKDGETTIANITGSQSDLLTAGHVGVELSNSVGSGTGSRLDNFVASDPPAALTAGTITVGTIGTTTAHLTATDATGGTPPYTYQWYRDTVSGFTPGPSNILSGKTTRTLDDTGLVRGTTYYYKIVYTDAVPNSVTSGQASLTACTSRCVCDGNSMTIGAGQNPYPTQLGAMLGSGWAMSNKGVGSQTTQNMIADAATDIDPLYEAGNTHNVVVCWEGINDIYFNASATDAYDHLMSYCQARRAVGWKVVIGTLTPRNDFPGGSTLPDDKHTNYETRRQSVNASIRANWRSFADAMADVAGDARVGPDGKEEDTNYYDSTKVHMVTAGYEIVASYVAEAIQMALNPGGAAPSGGLVIHPGMAGGMRG